MKKPKIRNPIARAAWDHRGAGRHRNKALRGSGKVAGKAGRHPKHRGTRI